MKKLFFILLVAASFGTFAQGKKFKNANKFSEWVMSYYKNPEPQYLFEAFTFSTQDKTIQKAGSRILMMRFIASCLKNDTLRQREFFTALKDTREADFIYGFGSVLTMINTDHSLKLFEEFLASKSNNKYITDFDEMKEVLYVDLLDGVISSPEHLDMLWADFFATGSAASVEKIISKLSALEAKDVAEVAIGGSAQWSLISNGKQHDRVYEICQQHLSVAEGVTKKKLETVVTRIKELRKS